MIHIIHFKCNKTKHLGAGPVYDMSELIALCGFVSSVGNYSKTSLSGTPMGPAPSVPLSELSHLVKLDISAHSSQVQLKKNYFQSYTYLTHIGEL